MQARGVKKRAFKCLQILSNKKKRLLVASCYCRRLRRRFSSCCNCCYCNSVVALSLKKQFEKRSCCLKFATSCCYCYCCCCCFRCQIEKNQTQQFQFKQSNRRRRSGSNETIGRQLHLKAQLCFKRKKRRRRKARRRTKQTQTQIENKNNDCNDVNKCKFAHISKHYNSSSRSRSSIKSSSSFTMRALRVLLANVLVALVVALSIAANATSTRFPRQQQQQQQQHQSLTVKIGALLQDANHAQANVFIRTAKMINERKDATIKRALNIASNQNNDDDDEQRSTTFTAKTCNLFASSEQLESKQTTEDVDMNKTIASQSSSSVESSAQCEQQRDAMHLLAPLVRIEPMIEFLADPRSALEADEKVCRLIAAGARAIVNPTDGASAPHVQSICDNREILHLSPYSTVPRFSTTSLPTISSSTVGGGGGGNINSNVNSNQRQSDMTLNLAPSAPTIAGALVDLIRAWNWTSLAIVSDSSASMARLQDLVRLQSPQLKLRLFFFSTSDDELVSRASSNKSSLNAAAHFLAKRALQGGANSQATAAAPTTATSDDLRPTVELTNSDAQQQTNNLLPTAVIAATAAATAAGNSVRGAKTFRDIFWQLKASGETNVLLDVAASDLPAALKQAQQVGCMTEQFSYLLTSLDSHLVDMEDFKYSRTRITALSLLHLTPRNVSQSLHGDNDDDDDNNESELWQFGEAYLRQLGVLVSRPPVERERRLRTQYLVDTPSSSSASGTATNVDKRKLQAFRLSPSVVLGKSGGFIDPPSDAYDGYSARAIISAAPTLVSSMQASASLLQSSSSSSSSSTLGAVGSQSTFDERALRRQQQFDAQAFDADANAPQVRLSTASAILHDSVLLLVAGLREMLSISAQEIRKQQFANVSVAQAQLWQPVSCELESPTWRVGSSLANYVRRTQHLRGLTGKLSLDERGIRENVELSIVSMAPEIGMITIGSWKSQSSSSTNQVASQYSSNINVNVDVNDSNDEAQRVKDKGNENESKRLKQALKKKKKQQQQEKSFKTKFGSSLTFNKLFFEHLFEKQADMIDTLIVTTKLSQPYFMLKETPNKLEGNEQYEGFAVDLIHELSKLINFRYRFKEVADKKYGSREVLANGTEIWNGLIGDIVNGQADIGIVDLTITSEREEAVDFTLPFMNTGISILFKKPTTKVTTLFSFLSPFSADVWAYVLAAYCGISGVLFFVGHISPYEWADPHPCSLHKAENEQTILKNQFSLLNSFWFTIGSLMQQGSDLTPRSMSTRTIAGIWYFFTLIMISSYTANLAAFLTVEKVVYPIENVRDLSNQQEIRYGCVESGSTCTFFKRSQIDMYKKIYQTMAKLNTYVKSNDDGQKKVEEGKFAFFMESASIEYITERNCNLTQIGGSLDSKGYGIATRKHPPYRHPYRTLLSSGILHLQETGMLHTLKNRWWKEKRGGGACADDGKGGGVTELSLANVGGVFVVLLGGLAISFLVAIVEFMWRASRNGATRDKVCEEMMRDLKFALACKRSTKPISEWRKKVRPTLSLQTSTSQTSETQNSYFVADNNHRQMQQQQQQHQLFYNNNNNRNTNKVADVDFQQQQQQQLLQHSHDYPGIPFAVQQQLSLTYNNNQQQLQQNHRHQQRVSRNLHTNTDDRSHLTASISNQLFQRSFEYIDDDDDDVNNDDDDEEGRRANNCNDNFENVHY